MKRFFIAFTLLFAVCLLPLSAQTAADKIVGYRAQVVWLENMKNPDGTLRTDVKNPDESKRKTPSNQIVLVDKVTYNGEDAWEDGKIYDPTSGKVYRVEMYFEKPNVLTVKGKLGPFFKKVYWNKIQ